VFAAPLAHSHAFGSNCTILNPAQVDEHFVGDGLDMGVTGMQNAVHTYIHTYMGVNIIF